MGNKLVFGVGVNDGKYHAFLNNNIVKEYDLWYSMLRRCYGKSVYNTYIGCEVSDNFKHYSYFYEWCHKQIGFGNEGWQLDKDLLVKGNKTYNEYSCVFIPKELNSLLVKHDAKRGEHPLGVCWHKRYDKFTCSINLNNGKRKHLGYFETEHEAFNTYKQAKEAFVKEQANKWKGQIDERAYQALIKYAVEITD